MFKRQKSLPNPTPKQIERRELAMHAKQLLTNEMTSHIFGLARERAVKLIREAKTPDEAWNARALLVGHDQMVGLLYLVAKDEKYVERELSEEAARAAGEEAQRALEEAHANYLERADEARKAVRDG